MDIIIRTDPVPEPPKRHLKTAEDVRKYALQACVVLGRTTWNFTIPKTLAEFVDFTNGTSPGSIALAALRDLIAVAQYIVDRIEE